MREKIIKILLNNNIDISNKKIEFDSLQILDIVSELEKTFKITIQMDDIKFSNFSDLEKIESFINRCIKNVY